MSPQMASFCISAQYGRWPPNHAFGQKFDFWSKLGLGTLKSNDCPSRVLNYPQFCFFGLAISSKLQNLGGGQKFYVFLTETRIFETLFLCISLTNAYWSRPVYARRLMASYMPNHVSITCAWWCVWKLTPWAFERTYNINDRCIPDSSKMSSI